MNCFCIVIHFKHSSNIVNNKELFTGTIFAWLEVGDDGCGFGREELINCVGVDCEMGPVVEGVVEIGVGWNGFMVRGLQWLF